MFPSNTKDYVELISLVNETNRPPGGKKTVRYWIQNAFLNASSRVLEIGCNTGFTSLELVRCIGCHATGIDVSEAAIGRAKMNLADDCPTVQQRVEFLHGDVENLQFGDDSFDAVICGGALSFVRNRQTAITEIHRVLRPWGALCVSPLCYHTEPPCELLFDIEQILGFPIPRLSAHDWRQLIIAGNFEEYHSQEVKLSAVSQQRVQAYVKHLVATSDFLRGEEERASLVKCLFHVFETFNRNHYYLQFLAGVFRRREVPEQDELFRVADPNY